MSNQVTFQEGAPQTTKQNQAERASEQPQGPNQPLETLNEGLETCKGAVATGVSEFLSYLPGTAEHTVRKAAQDIASPDAVGGGGGVARDIDVATGWLLSDGLKSFFLRILQW